MIDLSYLTDDEQKVIMAVLKRDAELKKAEDERVRQWQKQDPDEGKLKYITGEWFYEVKSQRHQDRIHGSDIIMASMKQKKALTVEVLTPSWREQPIKTNDSLMTPQPKSPETLMDRKPGVTQQGQNKPRQNPFNNVPPDLDLDLPIGAEAMDPPEELPDLKTQERTEKEAKDKVFDNVQEITPLEKPVPKKRTKFQRSGPVDNTSFISAQSVSTKSSVYTQSASSSTKSPVSTQNMSTSSDSRSTLSSQSTSTNSEIRSLPSKHILKHTYSCSSSGSNIKSQLAQPGKSQSTVCTKTDHKKTLEENAIPQERIVEPLFDLKEKEPPKPPSPLKSTFPELQLPVRSSELLNNPTQSAQVKPKIQPRLRLSSGTQSNDEQKSIDILHTQQKCENNLNWPEITKPEKQIMADGIMKEPVLIRRTMAKSPYEALLAKPFNEGITPQISLRNREKDANRTTKREHNKTEERGHHSFGITDHILDKATNPADVSDKTDDPLVKCERDYSPFNMKINRDTNMKTRDCKNPLTVNSHSPKASEEQGDSIAKVLEWFSRSSDSSDRLECDDIIQDTEDDIKFDDMDFEDKIDSRPKPENSFNLIISKQRDGDFDVLNGVFTKESDLTVEPDIDKIEPPENDQEPIGRTKPFRAEAIATLESVNQFNHRSPQHTMSRLMDPKTSQKEKVHATSSKKQERRNADKSGISDNKPIHQELEDLEDSQTPKTANLKSLWHRRTTEQSVMLVNIPNINSEKENFDLGKGIDYDEEPTEVETSPVYLVLENKEQANVKNTFNVGELEYNDIICEHINEKEANVRDKPKNTKEPITNIIETKDRTALSSSSDKDFSKFLVKKSSSSLDFGLHTGIQSNDIVGASVSSNDKGHTTEAVLEEELQLKYPPTSSVYPEQHNEVPFAKQRMQKEEKDNRAERIKDLTSFWERENLQSKMHIKSTTDAKPSSTSTKLNKRFTKSEYDLRSVGTESETDPENLMILPLQDRTEKTGEAVHSLPFKMLRDFWEGSNKHSSSIESKTQIPLHRGVKHANAQKEGSHLESKALSTMHSLSQNIYPNQSEEQFGNNGNATLLKTDKGFHSPLKEKTGIKHPDTGTRANLHISPTEPDALRSSHCPQPISGAQLSPDDTANPKLGMLNKGSQQNVSSGKGTLNGRGNSLRRATSMFTINMKDQDSSLQSKSVPDTAIPQLEKTMEDAVFLCTRTPEVNSLVKESPERTKNIHKSTLKNTLKDSEFQPLSRSFVPRDFQNHLGLKENRGKYSSPQVTEMTSELVCTPFTTGRSCCAEQDDIHMDCAELYTRRECLEQRPSRPVGEDFNPETLNSASSFSGESANFTEVSLVQEVLRRSATRPVYHKSFEDMTAVPRQARKSKRMDDFMLSSHTISSSPSPPLSSFSDKQHLRKISKSVPSFLEEKNDGNESDSEWSSNSGLHWKNSSPHAILNNNSRDSTLSTMSGSVMSISSVDFASVEVRGTIQFSINYFKKLKEFHIFVVQCQNLAAVDVKRNRSDPYVKSYLIPDTANLGKRKTSVKKKTLDPIYNEILRYRIRMEYLKSQILNLSVWHNDTFGRNTFLGETEIDLSSWDFGNPQINCLSLKPRTMTSILSTGDRGEMRLAIRFLPHISFCES